MKQYRVTITGETPLLHNHDNLDWDSVMKTWAKDPANKGTSVAGDDRSPAFRWIGKLYRYDGAATIPSDNLMTALREGGACCPTGKGQKTFKSLTQSGLLVDQAQWALLDPRAGRPYNVDGVEGLIDEPDYAKHEAWVAARGFSLFAKRAKVGMAKHVRVRPRFDRWAAEGTITVLDEVIEQDILERILTFAGAYSGLCDWRPKSPRSPGMFGRFSVAVNKA